MSDGHTSPPRFPPSSTIIAETPPPPPPAAPSSHLGATSVKKTSAGFHFLAGLASGVSSAVLLQPADLLKTRVQQSGSSSSTLRPVLRAILNGPHPVATLWRGTLPSALRTGVGSALYFTSLNALRQGLAKGNVQINGAAGLEQQEGLEKDGAGSKKTNSKNSSSVLPKLSSTQNMATGATARVMAGFLMMPITVIKVRYESDFYAYRSMYSASRDILMREGVRGFFSGFGATAIRDAPYAGLYVVFYESCKKHLNELLPTPAPVSNDKSKKSHQQQQSSTITTSAATSASINFASGVLAAGLATSITNPFDAVKTRLQLLPTKYGNTLTAARTMLREDGWRSFFSGLGLRMSRKALSSALAWTVYEELIGRAERRFAREQEDQHTAASVL